MDAVRRIRDLLILDDTLVIAADSIGGIGPKPADTVTSDAVTVAHFALRVPLLEVLCAGARPIAVIDTLCVELEPTGAPMIEEIRRLAAEAGVAPLAVTGSTEENVATRATAIGVTVIGRVGPGELLSGGSHSGDVVICAGLPLSAPHDQVWIGHPGQVTVAAAAAVVASGLVHDALPVGSRGVAWELAQLAGSAGLVPDRLDAPGVSLTASGGPASCVLFSCHPDSVEAVRGRIDPATPVHIVARLR
ncbi:MAG TPA: AIR synthase related protein [Propionicimonas sp.]|uniref:AIR synthase related protein n=1 Tax=Propionicimonas sp. TaxID=1955623 RepID=UPI002F42EC15